MKAEQTPYLAVALGALLVAAARPAAAHFLWGEVTPAPSATFRLTFGEGAEDKTPASLLERVRGARAWSLDGKPLVLKPKAGGLQAVLPPNAKLVGVEQTWGVLDRRPEGRGRFLLRYYAKAAADATAAASSVKLPVEVSLEPSGGVWVATVRHEGRPAAGAEVSLACPGEPAPLALKTDGAGQVHFAVEQPGRYQVRAMVLEWKPGKHGGEKYDLVRHYTTLTFPVAVKSVDAAALLQACLELRETWDERFPGFSAQLRMEQDGKSAVGTATISAGGEVEVKLSDPGLQTAAESMLRSMPRSRASTTGMRPVVAAIMSGVISRLLRAFGSPPRRRRDCRPATSPRPTASNRSWQNLPRAGTGASRAVRARAGIAQRAIPRTSPPFPSVRVRRIRFKPPALQSFATPSRRGRMTFRSWQQRHNQTGV